MESAYNLDISEDERALFLVKVENHLRDLGKDH